MRDREQILIAGPCAAESREQVLETAAEISALCSAHPIIYRAGAWKPRTSPSTFRGCGEEALLWLKEVKERYHMPVATEIATPEHAEAALRAELDYLWIGARTAANPIAVQAIADSLQQAPTKPQAVLVKNPVNEDAALWLGNIERLEAAGQRVIAVHRGCLHKPCWAMAYALRKQRPDIELLLDPSHMTGERSLVGQALEYISRLALDGAMIEVHHAPETALSDAAQQISPQELAALLPTILAEPAKDTQLQWYRAEIDELDDEIWQNLLKRMEVSSDIGRWKKEHHIAPLQPERFEQILHSRIEWGEKNGLDRETIADILGAIHRESLRRQ